MILETATCSEKIYNSFNNMCEIKKKFTGYNLKYILARLSKLEQGIINFSFLELYRQLVYLQCLKKIKVKICVTKDSLKKSYYHRY